jgi:hypothetical protein
VEGDGSTRERGECEGCLWAAEPSGAADDQTYDVVESLGASVVDVQPDRGELAVGELAERLGGLDERGQARAAGSGDPPVDQLFDRVGGEVANKDRAERLGCRRAIRRRRGV